MIVDIYILGIMKSVLENVEKEWNAVMEEEGLCWEGEGD